MITNECKDEDYLYSQYGVVNCIKKELYSSAENAVAIGFYLDEIERLNLYTVSKFYKNFKSQKYKTPSGIVKFTQYTFYDYCKDEFNLSRRSVDRYMNIFKSFCSYNGFVRTKFIDKKYEKYNASQLAEILGLSDRQRESVKPNMSVKEIRKLKTEKEDSVSESVDFVPAPEDEIATFLNKNDAIDVDDVNIDDNSNFEDKTFKKNKYHKSKLYDKFVSNPAQYSQQFLKVQEYLNNGYLLRLVLYAPHQDGGATND